MKKVCVCAYMRTSVLKQFCFINAVAPANTEASIM